MRPAEMNPAVRRAANLHRAASTLPGPNCERAHHLDDSSAGPASRPLRSTSHLPRTTPISWWARRDSNPHNLESETSTYANSVTRPMSLARRLHNARGTVPRLLRVPPQSLPASALLRGRCTGTLACLRTPSPRRSIPVPVPQRPLVPGPQKDKPPVPSQATGGLVCCGCVRYQVTHTSPDCLELRCTTCRDCHSSGLDRSREELTRHGYALSRRASAVGPNCPFEVLDRMLVRAIVFSSGLVPGVSVRSIVPRGRTATRRNEAR